MHASNSPRLSSLKADRNQAVPGVRLPWQSLPSAEMGTAHSKTTVIIHYTLTTDTAVYQFQVNQDKARVTRWVLKGRKGRHASTTMSTEMARRFARQLQTK
jgi:hypothetical protein